MVALKQLFDDPVVEFVAGRTFLLHGTTYQVGDTVTNETIRDSRNRESLIRSRRVVPVTIDLNEVPRAYRKEIADRQLFFKKNRRADARLVDPTDRLIPVIQKALEARPTVRVWAHALAKEVLGANRVTLVDFIKAGTTGAAAADIETYVKADGSYAGAGSLVGLTKADVVAAAYPAA